MPIVPLVRRTQSGRTAAARATLVAAAVAILSERGFAQATTANIALRAGLTTGALHHHFPTKESLFLAVLEETTVTIDELFARLSEEGAVTQSAAATLIDALWQVFGKKQYWAVWEINMGLRSDPVLYPQLIAHRRETRERLYRTIQGNAALSDPVKAALTDFMPFMLSSMRGIFLETFMQTGDAYLQDQLEKLTGIFQQVLDRVAQKG